MAWSYRKRIKIIPGVRLNISKSGISTSIGVKGASMTFGRNGTYLNTSIPALGLHNRTKIGRVDNKPTPGTYYGQPVLPSDNIFSADLQEITSQDMAGIKEAVIMAINQSAELKEDLMQIKTSLTYSKLKLFAGYFLLFGLFNRALRERIRTDINAKKDASLQLEREIENCCVPLDIAFDPDVRIKYERVIDSFKKLSASLKIWDVTAAHNQNRVAARSAASTIVTMQEVHFGIRSLPYIKSSVETLWLKNANGADLYFYPNFIVMYSGKKEFALIGLHEINLAHTQVRFVETKTIPADSKIIDMTWAKVNKNGTPDKRFKDNYQIPIVRYGVINLTTGTGLNEQYQFSNYEHSIAFTTVFKDYTQALQALGRS